MSTRETAQQGFLASNELREIDPLAGQMHEIAAGVLQEYGTEIRYDPLPDEPTRSIRLTDSFRLLWDYQAEQQARINYERNFKRSTRYFNSGDALVLSEDETVNYTRLVEDHLNTLTGEVETLELLSFGSNPPQESRILLRFLRKGDSITRYNGKHGFLVFEEGGVGLWKTPYWESGLGAEPIGPSERARDANSFDLRRYHPHLIDLQKHLESSQSRQVPNSGE